MIKNFNFYDVYGFLLPGVILLALLWLPLGLTEDKWPEAKVASALIAVIFGYIAGHVLQTIAANFIRSTAKDKLGNQRYPSNIFLDKDNQTFTDEFKTQLAERIKTLFGINVNVDFSAKDIASSEDKIDGRRWDAFLLCRSVLIKSKTASYAEQHEGMYAMMRGLCLAFILGFTYNAGWALSGLLGGRFESNYETTLIVGLVIAIIASAVSIWKRNNKSGFLFKISVWGVMISLAVTLTTVGNYMAHGKAINDVQRNLLSVIVLGSLFAALRCYGAFKEHTELFARAVYRDFYVYEKEGAKDKGEVNSGGGADEGKDEDDN